MVGAFAYSFHCYTIYTTVQDNQFRRIEHLPEPHLCVRLGHHRFRILKTGNSSTCLRTTTEQSVNGLPKLFRDAACSLLENELKALFDHLDKIHKKRYQKQSRDWPKFERRSRVGRSAICVEPYHDPQMGTGCRLVGNLMQQRNYMFAWLSREPVVNSSRAAQSRAGQTSSVQIRRLTELPKMLRVVPETPSNDSAVQAISAECSRDDQSCRFYLLGRNSALALAGSSASEKIGQLRTQGKTGTGS